MGTSGRQLYNWCKKNDVSGFAGVFCSDTLPGMTADMGSPNNPNVNAPMIVGPDGKPKIQTNSISTCFIFNHSVCASGGTHWLACRIIRTPKMKKFTRHCEWFDSYGLPPDNKLEDEFMTKKGEPQPDFVKWLEDHDVKSVTYNDRDLQSVSSKVCGLYACYFAKHGLPENNPAWNWLTTDPEANDLEIQKRVNIKVSK